MPLSQALRVKDVAASIQTQKRQSIAAELGLVLVAGTTDASSIRQGAGFCIFPKLNLFVQFCEKVHG